MSRRPPRSPLFPYTRLSRSRRPRGRVYWNWRCAASERLYRLYEGRRRALLEAMGPDERAYERRVARGGGGVAQRCSERSEEHTSELQSRQYLVCRLLLEKKN